MCDERMDNILKVDCRGMTMKEIQEKLSVVFDLITSDNYKYVEIDTDKGLHNLRIVVED